MLNNSSSSLAAVILAAGLGTRMKSALPKVMHPLAGRPMIQHLMATVSPLKPDHIVVVVGPGMESVGRAVAPARTAVQEDRLGTAHAVLQAQEALRGFVGDVLVLYGDTPLISEKTLARLLEERRSANNPAVVVLGFTPKDPGQYGRLVLDEAQGLQAIVEWKEASEEERRIPLCNSGVMALDGQGVWELLGQIDNANAKGEFYLTDIVKLARAQGRSCAVVQGEEEELQGVNSRVELAVAESVVQQGLRRRAMDNGATLIAPETVWFSWDTQVGKDVTVWPHVVFGEGVIVEDGVQIKGFCHFDHCHIETLAEIGPYARLRPGAHIGAEAHIGNFVEIKKSVIERQAKVNHLTYIGDARIGRGSNIGAGTITCNYDGFNKWLTDIGEDVFVGSNTSLVAPVKVGDGAMIGAGSVVTKDVESGALAVARGKQVEIVNGATRFRSGKKR